MTTNTPKFWRDVTLAINAKLKKCSEIQVKEKVNALKKRYRTTIDKNKDTGARASTCQNFEVSHYLKIVVARCFYKAFFL